MNSTFIESGCQNFEQSPCQNRDSGPAEVSFNLTSASSAQGPSGCQGANIIAQFTAPNPFIQLNTGTINSVNLAAYTWNISWIGGAPTDESVILFGVHGWVQGPASKLYGTISIHQYPSAGFDLGPYVAIVLLNGSAGQFFDSSNVGGRESPEGIIVFWVGRVPAQIPTGSINFASTPFGNVLNIEQG